MMCKDVLVLFQDGKLHKIENKFYAVAIYNFGDRSSLKSNFRMINASKITKLPKFTVFKHILLFNR